jgi:hypothetical protein
MKWNKTIVLSVLAIAGSIIAYFTVNTFIVPVTIGQYILIEIIISTLHALYNKAKIQSLNN